MLNSYGYNRKTLEEDQKILEAVKQHHKIVESHGYMVIMTVLVGSQNYDLDDENSDIDTFSFIYPHLEELAFGDKMKAGVIIAKDGHCNFKDIRTALQLFQKTSPNSVEYFTSKYKVYNPAFEPIFRKFLNNGYLWDMVHCNYKHMLGAMAGMAHQITNRNMPVGKRFAHALRLDNMLYHFFNSYNAEAILEMRPGGDRDLALIAKRDTDPNNAIHYDRECEEIANKLDNYKDKFELDEQMELTQKHGLNLINQFQLALFKQYLKEIEK